MGIQGLTPRDFPRAKKKDNCNEQPCQPEENPVPANYFTHT